MRNPQPLHPNLARLAGKRAALLEDMRRGALEPQEAMRRISNLRTLDDLGVQWNIGPDGIWRFVDSTGALRPGTPPSEGIATPFPEDISTPVFNLLSPVPALEKKEDSLVGRVVEAAVALLSFGSVLWMAIQVVA